MDMLRTGGGGRASLSPTQRRVAADLLDPAGGTAFRAGLARELREALEEAVAPFLPWPGPPLSVAKERLNEADRCEGLFDADVSGERPPFAHGPASAAGTLAHKSVELDVRAREERPATEIVRAAASRLQRDRRFRPYWEGLREPHRAALLARVERSVGCFRASFPSVRRFRRHLAPVTELWLESTLGVGAVVLRGKVDLLLGSPRPERATRVLIDLKDGRPSPDHVEDMRVYALLYTLRTGVPPFRVATFFLASGEWQAEDVTEQALERARERVAGAVGIASRLRAGGDPALRPGRHCLRCPRVQQCPAVVGER